MNLVFALVFSAILLFRHSNCSDEFCTLRQCTAIEQRLQRQEIHLHRLAESFQQTLTALIAFEEGNHPTESYHSILSNAQFNFENATSFVSSVDAHQINVQLEHTNHVIATLQTQLIAQNKQIVELDHRIAVLENVLNTLQYVDRPGNQSTELTGALKCSMSHMLDIDHSLVEHDSELSVTFEGPLMIVSWTLPSAECFDYLTGLWLRIGPQGSNIESETAHLIPNECLRRAGTRLNLTLSTSENRNESCQFFLRHLDECSNYSLQVVPNYLSLKGNSSSIEMSVPPRDSGSALADIRSQITYTGFDLSWTIRSDACAALLDSIRVRVFQDSAQDSLIPPVNEVTLDRNCIQSDPSNRFSSSFPSLEANCSFQWQEMAKCRKYRLVLDAQFADRWLTSSALHEFFASESGPLQSHRPNSCPVNQFHCGSSLKSSSSSCLSLDRVCDGISDCGDGSDEFDCGGGCHLLVAESGTFPHSSPLHSPGTYTISVQSGHVIWLSFSQFESDNLVKVYEGTCSTGSLLLAHSGRSIPHSIRSTSSNIYVEIPANSSALAYYTSVPANAFHSFADGCGGYINGQGKIISPVIADARNARPECWWYLEHSDDRHTLLLENSNSFGNSYTMTVYDGWHDNGSVLNIQDGNSTTRSDVFSLSNRMRVRFQSTGNPFDTFYQWTVSSVYTPQCWYNMTASSGRIFSADYQLNSSQSHMDCRWNIRDSSDSSAILLQFGYFDRVNSGSIQIHDGPHPQSPILLSTSGGVSPLQTVHSSTNELLIRLTNKQSSDRLDFLIIYSSQESNVTNSTFNSTTVAPTTYSPVCLPVRMNQTDGWFTSPNHPSSYWNNIYCSWLITAEPGRIIQLQFTSFQTEQCCDFLRVYDGNSSSDTLLFQHSGSLIPRQVESTSSFLFVTFSTDGSVVSSGFNATFQSLENRTISIEPALNSTTVQPTTNTTLAPLQDCTYYLNGESGSFTSPNFPSNYTDNARCRWLITSHPDTTIQVQFDQFSTEPCCDHIRIYDGPSESSTLILQHSGHFSPPAMESTSNVVLVTFSTDGSVVSSGFNATFQAFNRTSNATHWTFSNCSHVLNAESGSFTSPNHPGRYPNDTRCSWLIITPPGTTILLKFQAFATDPCCDFIKVYDGSSTLSTSILERSGLIHPASVESTANVLLVTFTAEAQRDLGFSGFNATFESLNRTATLPDRNCSYILEDDLGAFTSPNYPGNYSNDLRCTWLITTRPDYIIQLRFDHVATENCCDIIRIYDGPSNEPVRQLSGTSFDNSPLESTTNDLLITFITDGSIVGRGFNASYWIVPRNASSLMTSDSGTNCTYNLTAGSGVFTSPNYPDIYSNNLRCTWLITSDVDTTIQLRFNNFSTESCCDFVSVHDGSTESSPLLLRHSNHALPNAIRSTSNVLLVTFTTDGSVVASGFEAVYEAIRTANNSTSSTEHTTEMNYFNSTFNSTEQTNFTSMTTLRPDPYCNTTLETEFELNFTSPNYPGSYDNYIRCSYFLRTPPGTQIQLQFHDFSTEVCCDHIRVYDGNSSALPPLLQHSGTTIPATVQSTSNVMLVTFFTDHSIVSAGFHAAFQAVEPHSSNNSRQESNATIAGIYNQTDSIAGELGNVTEILNGENNSTEDPFPMETYNETIAGYVAFNETATNTRIDHVTSTEPITSIPYTNQSTAVNSTNATQADYFDITSRIKGLTSSNATSSAPERTSTRLTAATSAKPLTRRSTQGTPEDDASSKVTSTAASRLRQSLVRLRTLHP